MDSHVYQDQYYDYIDAGSARSADRVIAIMQKYFDVGSILDVGCGRGAWLARWHAAGVTDFHGVDGEYVEVENLPFAASHFTGADLKNALSLQRKFDLVQSVEVAEHLPEAYAEQFVDTITSHGEIIMFSAATVGQGGEHHVNEQPLDYWREKFAARGYDCFDVVRPQIIDDGEIEPWYRFNLLVYIKSGHPAASKVAEFKVAPETGVPDLSPLWWRLRNKCLSVLGNETIDRLARVKHTVYRTFNRA